MSDDSSDGSGDLNRRDFIGKLGAAGAVGVVGTSAITPAQAREAAENVEQLTGYDRWYQIQRARRNDEVRDLVEQFRTEGRGPNYGEANAYRSVDEEDGTEYNTVVVPMEQLGGQRTLFTESTQSTETVTRTNSMIVWTDNDDLDTVGHDFAHLGDKEWKNRVHKHQNGSVTVDEGTLDFEKPAGASMDQAGASAAETEALGCPDLDWKCVMGMASSFSFMFFNCGKCVVSGFADAGGCFFCVANIIGAGSALCDPCPAEDGWPFNPDDGPNGGTEAYKIGHEIVATDAVNVRTDPTVGDNVTFAQPAGTVGWIKNGYVTNGGFTWWKIEWDNGKLGWSPQSKFERH